MQVEQIDQIDKIRNEFFEKLKKEDEEKQAKMQEELEKKQATCSHKYMWCRGSDFKRCAKCHHKILIPPREGSVVKKCLCTIC
jgi:hypothetical protein